MSTDTDQEQQEFDAAFAEMAKPESDSAAQPTSAQPSPTESAQAAPPVVAEQTASEADEGQPDSSKAQAPKPTSDLDRQLAEALHRERSSANRLSHFMRENNRLTSELAKAVDELKKARVPAADQAPRAAAGTKDVLAEAPDLEAAVNERVTKATESLSAKIEEQQRIIQELTGKTDSAARAVEPLVAKQHQDQISRTQGELDKMFGQQWRSDISSSAFAKWIGEQNPDIQRLYQTGATVRDASTVMHLFYATSGARKPTQQPAASQASAPAPAGQPAASDRLRKAAGIKPGTVVRPTNRNDDFEGSFAEFASLRQSQRNQAGFR